MMRNQAGGSDSTVYMVYTVYVAAWEVARGRVQFQHGKLKQIARGQAALVTSSLEKYTVSTMNTLILPSVLGDRNKNCRCARSRCALAIRDGDSC
jgi:hypothetical protein